MLFKICATLTGMLLLTGCATTPIAGEAGCGAYAEARVTMPADPEALPDGWLRWVAEMDTRMTATCNP